MATTTTTVNSPLTLPCGVTLKNRVCKAAMTENLADPLGRATQRHCTLYRAWATGGCGMLITGNVQVDRRFLERPGNICLDGEPDREALERLRALAAAGSSNDCSFWVQLGHAGRQSTAKVNREPVGPSAVGVDLPRFAVGQPRALTAEEVRGMPGKFAVAAHACQAAGFAGVQVHSAHGYLLSSFLNPRANLRTDEWGGSLRNRVGLLLATVHAVRAAVGPAFGLSVKLNTSDFQKGGFSNEEAVEVALLLGRSGEVDLLELSGGNYESPTICGSSATVAAGGEDAEGSRAIQESTRLREAYYLVYCRQVLQALRDDSQRRQQQQQQPPDSGGADWRGAERMRVMLTGGFRSLAAMNGALGDGDCDVIGLGRPLCGAAHCVNDLLVADVAAAGTSASTSTSSITSSITTTTTTSVPSSFRLPSYEDSLRPGWGVFRSLLNQFKLGRSVLFIATQSWYYCRIYALADGATPAAAAPADGAGTIGCFAALVRNDREENRVAAALVGPDCVGTAYAGPAGANKNNTSAVATRAIVVAVLVLALAARWFSKKLL
jgi:2,4-dienoyl-CoA reductase-like NADH-dependent reductase (Old Yellow Enzyme family)